MFKCTFTCVRHVCVHKYVCSHMFAHVFVCGVWTCPDTRPHKFGCVVCKCMFTCAQERGMNVCVHMCLSWFIHCHSFPDFLCYNKNTKTRTTMAMWQNAEHQPHIFPQSTIEKPWAVSCKHLHTSWTSCTVINFPDTMWVSLQHTKPNTDLRIFRIRTYLVLLSCDLMHLYLMCSLLNVR